jgi:hypothetical protein
MGYMDGKVSFYVCVMTNETRMVMTNETQRQAAVPAPLAPRQLFEDIR